MCAYPTIVVSDDGKKKKIYNETMTPCQKLLSIPNVEIYLNKDMTVEILKARMKKHSHIEFAKIMAAAKQKLFAAIKKC